MPTPVTLVYAKGLTGDDAALGTINAPVKTLSRAKALTAVTGGTINIAEVFRESVSFSAAYSGVTLQQWSGQTTSWIRGDVVIAGPWTHIGNQVYTAPLAAGLVVKWLMFDWLNRVNARGAHYGTVPCNAADAAAVTTFATAGGASAARGKAFYNNATGLVTGFFAGLNPNSVEVGWVNRENQKAIEFLGGTANFIRGIHIGCWHNSIQGGGMWMEDQVGSSMEDNFSFDCGPHPYIHLAEAVQSSANRILRNLSNGAVYNATHTEQFVQDATGTPLDFLAKDNIVESHLWLGLDGQEIPELTVAGGHAFGNTQLGFFCHAGSGTFMKNMVIADMLWRFTGTDASYAGGARPVAGDNILRPVEADAGNRTKYGIWARGGRYEVISGASGHPTVPLSFGVCYEALSLVKPDANLSTASFGTGQPGAFPLGFDSAAGGPGYDRFCLLNCVEEIANLRVGDAASSCMHNVNDSNTAISRLIRNHCSMENTSDLSGGNFEAIDDHLGATTGKIEDHGSIVKHAVAGSAKAFAIGDGNLTPGLHRYDELSISGVSDASSRYSQRAGCGSLSGFRTNIDPKVRDDTGRIVFPNAPTDLRIEGGVLFNVATTTAFGAPTYGIGKTGLADFSTRFGAWQDPYPMIARIEYRPPPDLPRLYAFHYFGYGGANAATGGVAVDAFSAAGVEARFATYIDALIALGFYGHVIARYAGEGANHKGGVYPTGHPSGPGDVNSAVWNEVKNASSTGDSVVYMNQFAISASTRKSRIYPLVFYGGPATFNAAQADAAFFQVPYLCGGEWYVDVGSVLSRGANPKQKTVQTAALAAGVWMGFEPFDLRGYVDLDAWFSEAATAGKFSGFVCETARHLGSATRAEVALADPVNYYTKQSIGAYINTGAQGKAGRASILIPANGGTVDSKIETMSHYVQLGYDIWIDVDPLSTSNRARVGNAFQQLAGSFPARRIILDDVDS